jgi:hypothetical protein
MEKALVAAGLVVNIETGALARGEYLPWLENRELGRHGRDYGRVTATRSVVRW